MTNPRNYKKLFEEILTSGEFHQLSSFTEPTEWDSLTGEEKELLSLLFVMQGEKQLVEGSNQVLESFRIANRIAPDNMRIMYRQAMAFSRQIHNQFCLKTACKIFEKALEVYPDSFDLWHGWGNTLATLGVMNQESTLISEAISKYVEAEKYFDNIDIEKTAAFYHDFGMCWFTSGRLSGEPQDFRIALEQYQHAVRLGFNTSSFWNDYGNAITELAHLVNKPEILFEAVEMYWKSIKIMASYQTGWFNLASTLKHLYQIFPQEAYFAFGHECFARVAKIDPHNSSVWLKWGELLSFRGKLFRDLEILKDSARKFEIADICEPNHPLILSSWGEALLHLGSWSEEQEFLKEALSKILKSLEIQKDLPKVWCLYGNCLNEFGKYFGDEKYFLEASEKFQYGLRFNSSDPHIWYGLAISIFALGQMREDPSLVYESSQYCMKVIESGGQNIPQFWNDWGLTLMKLANMTDEKRYLESAVNKFENALRLGGKSGIKAQQEAEWYYNLGCSYELLGDFEDSIATFEKALPFFKKSLEIDPSFYTAYYNLGCIYTRLGEITADIDYLIEANIQFEKLINNDPEDDQGWNEWGITLINLGEFMKDNARPDASRKFYAEAEKKFLQAAALGNTAATYHLACLHSLIENYDTSIYFLEKCQKNSILPPLCDLLQDEWLENVRQTPLFTHFLSQIEKREF